MRQRVRPVPQIISTSRDRFRDERCVFANERLGELEPFAEALGHAMLVRLVLVLVLVLGFDEDDDEAGVEGAGGARSPHAISAAVTSGSSRRMRRC